MWSSFYSVYIYQIITLYNFKYITILCVTYTSVNLGGVWDVSPSATYSTSWEHYYFSERVCWPFSTVCRKVFRKKRKEYSCIVCGKSIFSFKKNCQTIFQSGCTIVRSHWQAVSHPVSPHPHRYLVSSPLFTLAILIGVMIAHRGFNCISIMANDVEHLLRLFVILIPVC